MGNSLTRFKVRQPVVYGFLIFLILVTTFFLQLAWNPRVVGMNADSGLFAYGGQQILQGQLLYRDVWDTKPPGVFYVNALALLLGGDTPWAIWWLGLIWIGAAALIFFNVLSRVLGKGSAALGTLVFLFTLHHPAYYQGGNFTEVYALLPLMLTLSALEKYLSGRRIGWIASMGLFSALAFLFKPTYLLLGLVTIFVVVCLEIWQRFPRRIPGILLAFVLGISFPILVVAAYWAYKGALSELWNAVIVSNIIYTTGGLSLIGVYGTVRNLIILQPLASIFTIAAASFVFFIHQNQPWSYLNKINKLAPPGEAGPAESLDQDAVRNWFYAVMFLALPLEIVSLTLSGRNFGHYYLIPLPELSAAIAFLLYQVSTPKGQWRAFSSWEFLSITIIGFLLLAWSIEVLAKDLPATSQIISLLENPLYGSYKDSEIDRYIVNNTDASQSILVWGIQPDHNFRTGRRSPTRYVFSMALVDPPAGAMFRFAQLIDDLRQDPPALILAQRNSSAGIPFFGLSDEDLCPTCPTEVRQGLMDLRRYVETHYIPLDPVTDWLIYKRAATQ